MKEETHNLVQGVRNRQAEQQLEFEAVHWKLQNLEQLINKN